MADITQTPANVTLEGSGNHIYETVTYGETIVAGNFVYESTSNGRYLRADANASEATAKVKGMAITDGGDGEKGIVVTRGRVNVGGTTADATPYVLSDTPGGIKPASDLASSDYVTHLGYAVGTGGAVELSIDITGVQKT